MGIIGENGAGGFLVDGMRIISYSDTWEHHTIVRKCNIIFELDNNYYYIIETMDKLVEICSMPNTLQKEWFKYNKKVLTERFAKSEFEKQQDISRITKSEKIQESVSELKAILRNFNIDKII